MPQKIKMNQEDTMTFEEGFDQFLLDCKARNLREGTIRHYSMQIKQIWKYIPKETRINSSLGCAALGRRRKIIAPVDVSGAFVQFVRDIYHYNNDD